ncbi:MAG TPA: class I SAM-dependent methyltransferase, partial [Hyphomicrobiaceae bacterium]|nr:class I SAM-dependent methyltransferase [Hyphomicrobiaceae bacterium]
KAEVAYGVGSRGSDTTLRVIATPGFADYALLDSGDGRKLERFGRFTIERPESQALWRPALEPGAWLRADAAFKSAGADEDSEGGRWRTNTAVPETWPVRVRDTTVLCRLTSFRHLGLFPEQLPHWEWMIGWLQAAQARPQRVLNLFAYTGAASLLAARIGAEVTHVDASRKAIAWAKQNQAVSRLDGAPIRWILDDARKFVAREVRRGSRYHLILVDPPKFGRGPNGEEWEVFAHLAPLLRDCAALLGPQRAALVLTTYAIRASALAMGGLVRECLAGRRGAIESGELAVIEEAAGRLLPTSLYTRWTSDEISL